MVKAATNYQWTAEQDLIISAIMSASNQLLVIEAIAGSAKSSTIVEAVQRVYKQFPSLNAEYTVFGNANASEARTEFGHSAQALTVHAKARRATVEAYGLKTPVANFLTWRDLPKSLGIPFTATNLAIFHVEKFCVSPYLTLQEYSESLDDLLSPSIFHATNLILAGLSDGNIRCTHAFYLKLYHIFIMNGTIILPELDILIADEAGDMTQISLDIFHKTPAKLKIVIGDSGQSIFGFMNLVSAFDRYRNEGLHLSLSKSFRVNHVDAAYVQAFCRDTFSPTLVFEGMHYPTNPTIKSKAYITRNNSTMLAKMIELDSTGTPFRLSSTTKIGQLFLWPLALLYLKAGNQQKNPDLKHLQADADKWGRTPSLKSKYTLRSYVLKQNENNSALVSANRLLMTYSPQQVITAYEAAESHLTSHADLAVLTAHTSKGLTFDSATLADDLNLAVAKALLVPIADRTQDDIETFKLYYVACTRSRHELINAIHLDKYKDN